MCDGIASLGNIRWCNVLAAYCVLVICKFQNRVNVDYIAQ